MTETTRAEERVLERVRDGRDGLVGLLTDRADRLRHDRPRPRRAGARRGQIPGDRREAPRRDRRRRRHVEPEAFITGASPLIPYDLDFDGRPQLLARLAGAGRRSPPAPQRAHRRGARRRRRPLGTATPWPPRYATASTGRANDMKRGGVCDRRVRRRPAADLERRGPPAPRRRYHGDQVPTRSPTAPGVSGSRSAVSTRRMPASAVSRPASTCGSPAAARSTCASPCRGARGTPRCRSPGGGTEAPSTPSRESS